MLHALELNPTVTRRSKFFSSIHQVFLIAQQSRLLDFLQVDIRFRTHLGEDTVLEEEVFGSVKLDCLSSCHNQYSIVVQNGTESI
jgi:hypothetical protein